MKNRRPQTLQEQLKKKFTKIKHVKNTKQVSNYISEGNPNREEEPLNIDNRGAVTVPEGNATDQSSAQMVKQAMNDDQALAGVAKDIRVTVKNGDITLNGKVFTDQQSNLASNTAKAVGMVDLVKNDLKIKPVL